MATVCAKKKSFEVPSYWYIKHLADCQHVIPVTCIHRWLPTIYRYHEVGDGNWIKSERNRSRMWSGLHHSDIDLQYYTTCIQIRYCLDAIVPHPHLVLCRYVKYCANVGHAICPAISIIAALNIRPKYMLHVIYMYEEAQYTAGNTWVNSRDLLCESFQFLRGSRMWNIAQENPRMLGKFGNKTL